MNNIKKEQHQKFLEEKDELVESLAEDFERAFSYAGPQSVWHVFTRAKDAAKEIQEIDNENSDKI